MKRAAIQGKSPLELLKPAMIKAADSRTSNFLGDLPHSAKAVIITMKKFSLSPETSFQVRGESSHPGEVTTTRNVEASCDQGSRFQDVKRPWRPATFYNSHYNYESRPILNETIELGRLKEGGPFN